MTLSDDREIALRIIESLSSGLYGFVFDVRLVDENTVRRVISNSGISGLLKRWSHGNIIVYYIDVDRIESICNYSECSGAKVKRVCISECIAKNVKKVSYEIVRSISEAYSL